MPITFDCPCGRRIRTADGSSGRTMACPACGQRLEVPPAGAIDLGIDLGEPSRPVARSPARSPTVVPSGPTVPPGPFIYKMVQLPPNIAIKEGTSHHEVAATYLEEVVNRYALYGWEFYRVDTIGVQETPGCLGSLLGQGPTTFNYYVVTFRRPRE